MVIVTRIYDLPIPSDYFKDPNTTMFIVLAAMFFLPMLIRRIRSWRYPELPRDYITFNRSASLE